MKALGVNTFGGPDAFEVLDLPEPQAGPGEVRVRVHAATVNPTDTLVRAGLRDLPSPPPYVPGMDAAGVVDQIGPDNDDRLSVGQRVVALVVPSGTHGAYSSQIVVPAASVVPAPEGADFAEASTLLMNAMTARIALDAMKLAPGSWLGVTGAAGSYGGYALQLGKADGLSVVADAKDSDFELVRELGADEVVERGSGFADRFREVAPGGVAGLADGAVLDEAVLPAVADGGAVATVRGWHGPAERGITVHPVFVRTAATDTAGLERLVRQAEEGALTLRVARVFPAEDAASAHRQLEAGGTRGRLVLDFS